MDLLALFGRKKDLITLAIDEAIELMGEKEYDSAIQVLEEKALRRNPEHRRAVLHWGICQMLRGDFARAEEALVPLTRQKGMDSERAAAEIALERIKRLRAEKTAREGGAE